MASSDLLRPDPAPGPWQRCSPKQTKVSIQEKNTWLNFRKRMHRILCYCTVIHTEFCIFAAT
uniref:Uncharacterized protein n=1 Tax=Aegilops tauschii TaxID=37682 RepID=R7W2A2_AEGTA